MKLKSVGFEGAGDRGCGKRTGVFPKQESFDILHCDVIFVIRSTEVSDMRSWRCVIWGDKRRTV